MSPESYSWETIEAAEELYIIDGLTFEQVAERTGVSVSQLKRWSSDAKESWPDRRREYRQAQVAVRRGVMLAKARLIESVIESEDPQKAYAFSALVSAGRAIDEEAQERNQGQRKEVAAGSATPITTPADAVAALQLAVQHKYSALVTSPCNLPFAATIKDIKLAMEMIDELQNKDAQAETDVAAVVDKVAAQQGLNAEQAAFWRQQILGVR